MTPPQWAAGCLGQEACLKQIKTKKHYKNKKLKNKGGGVGKSSPQEALQAAADEQLTTETQKYLVWRNSKDDIRGNSTNDLRNPSRVELKSLS